MGVLTLPRCSPLYGSQKPGIGSQIEWGHPLARGLAICIPMIEGGGAPRELVKGLSLAAAGSTSWAPRGVYYDAVGERNYVSGGYALPLPGISTMVRFTPRLIDSAAHHLFAATDSGIAIWMFKAQITSGNVARCLFRNGGVSGATTLVADKPYTVTGKYTSGGTQNVYLNGILDGTAAAASSATSLLGQVEVGVSQYDDANPASAIECAYVWNRELTADEVAWLHLEPYAFLISPVRRTYFPATTPSGDIAGAAAGAATVSGTLTGTAALASAAAGAATCQGTATGNGACAGAAAGVATVTATLTAAGALAGSSAGTATVAGSLGSESPIAGSCAGAASCSGTVTGNGSLAATAAGVATVTAVLLATGALTGSSAGTSTASLQNGVAASTEGGSIRISVAQARLRLVRTRIRVERPDV